MIKENSIVRFINPLDDDEKSAKMRVLEIRRERVLVTDLRFEKESILIKPMSVYLLSDLTEATND